MPLTQVGSAATAPGSAATSGTVAVPAGLATDDLVVLFVSLWGTASSDVPTVPAGFVEIPEAKVILASGFAGDSQTVHAYWKWYRGESGTYSISWSHSDLSAFGVDVVRGAPTTAVDPIDHAGVQTLTVGGGTTTSTQSVPIGSTQQPNEFVIGIAITDFGHSLSATGTMNSRQNLVDVAVLDIQPASAGAQANQSLTAAVSATEWVWTSVAVLTAPIGASTPRTAQWTPPWRGMRSRGPLATRYDRPVVSLPQPQVLSASITDSITLADSLAMGTFAPTRAMSDGITLGDSLSRAVTDARALTDSVTLSDSVARGAMSDARAIANTITLSDALTRAAESFARPVANSITLADSLARALALTRAMSDSVTLSDTIAALAGKTRALSDAVTLSNSLARGNLAFSRALSDAVTVVDSLARAGVAARQVANSITLSDAAVAQAGKARALSDSITLADAAARTFGVTRPLADTIVVSESLARGPVSVTRTIASSITLSDSMQAGRGVQRSFTDSLTLTDALVLSHVVPAASVISLGDRLTENVTVGDRRQVVMMVGDRPLAVMTSGARRFQ